MTTSGLTPQEVVAALPRRTAHALHALLEVEHDPSLEGGPFLASEVVVYDEEALTARSTAAALRAAQRLGLAVCAGGYWAPTFRGLTTSVVRWRSGSTWKRRAVPAMRHASPEP